MEHQNDLMELKEKFDQLLGGLSAIEVMVLGLAHAKDPYTDAFHTVWLYLRETADEIQKLLK